MRSRRSAVHSAPTLSNISESDASASVVVECPPPSAVASSNSAAANDQHQQQQQQQPISNNTNNQQNNVKVEGEIVNDLDRLKAVLDRGWDLNKKVVGVSLKFQCSRDNPMW